jgi:hypothetical protein
VELRRLFVGLQVGPDVLGLVELVAEEVGLLLARVAEPARGTEAFPASGFVYLCKKFSN